eukprot:2532878-Rhodomonas_salina.3
MMRVGFSSLGLEFGGMSFRPPPHASARIFHTPRLSVSCAEIERASSNRGQMVMVSGCVCGNAGGPLAKYLEETQALRRGAGAAISEMLPTDIIQEGLHYVHKGAKHLKETLRSSTEIELGRASKDKSKSKDGEEAGSEWGPDA